MWKEPEEFITPLTEPYEAALHHVLEASPQVNSNFLIKKHPLLYIEMINLPLACCDFMGKTTTFS